jgi:DNA ligase-1
LLKCKDFVDAEYVVLDAINSMQSYATPDGMKERMMLQAVVVEHKGSKVQVGSGFDRDEKIKYCDHPELIIGKRITVKYFEETANDKGGISLRFPTFKGIRPEGA